MTNSNQTDRSGWCAVRPGTPTIVTVGPIFGRPTAVSQPQTAATAVPAFGVKLDAVPGRLNETWVRVDKEGVYYGFCSELCGVNHSFMPIAVEVVSQERFDAWVKEAQTKFARVGAPDASLALAQRAIAR